MIGSSLVSICIPAFNAERFIRQTIESALAQTYSPVEIVIVDDGSTDRTHDIASEYCGRSLRVVQQRRAGAAAARNRAFAESTAEWIQFLDSDDLMDPQKLERQMSRAAALGPRFVYCSDWGRFASRPDDGSLDRSPLLADMNSCDWLIAKYSHNAMMHSAGWLVHRSAVERAGGWDERLTLNDDGEFFDRLVLQSDGVRYVAGATVYYRSSLAGSLSRSVTRKSAESAVLALDLCAGRLLEQCHTPAARTACAIQYQLLAFWCYPLHRDLAEEAASHAAKLGGAAVNVPGGRMLGRLENVLGWRAARTLQHWYYKARHG